MGMDGGGRCTYAGVGLGAFGLGPRAAAGRRAESAVSCGREGGVVLCGGWCAVGVGVRSWWERRDGIGSLGRARVADADGCTPSGGVEESEGGHDGTLAPREGVQEEGTTVR